MNEQEITRSGRAFDDLASGLANGTITRGRALKLAGASLLGVAGLGVAAREAASHSTATALVTSPSWPSLERAVAARSIG